MSAGDLTVTFPYEGRPRRAGGGSDRAREDLRANFPRRMAQLQEELAAWCGASAEACAEAAALLIARTGWTIGDVAEAASLGNEAAIEWSRWALRHGDPRWFALERVLEHRDPDLLEELTDEWMTELYEAIPPEWKPDT